GANIRICEREFVIRVEKEADNAGMLIEVREYRGAARHFTEGPSEVGGDSGGSDAGFRGHEGEEVVGRTDSGRMLLEERTDLAERLSDFRPLERRGKQFADAKAHRLPEDRRLWVCSESDSRDS